MDDTNLFWVFDIVRIFWTTARGGKSDMTCAFSEESLKQSNSALPSFLSARAGSKFKRAYIGASHIESCKCFGAVNRSLAFRKGKARVSQ